MRRGFRGVTGRAAEAAAWLVGLVLLVGAAACGDDGGPVGPPQNLDEIQGLYDVRAINFDPQGAAPEADVLEALAAGGVSPELNIARNGTFQLFYRDPVSGTIVPVNGTVEALDGGIVLVFPSQAAADQFVLPLRVPLTYDGTAGTLAFSGAAAVSRTRLQELFPDLYGAEPWTGETIPGELTLLFTR